MEKNNLTTPEVSIDESEFFVLPDASNVVTAPVAQQSILKQESNNALDDKAIMTNVTEAVIEDIDKSDFVENTGDKPVTTNTTSLVDFYEKKIKAGQILPFNDFEVLEDDPEYDTKLKTYLNKLSLDDFDQLWDANLARKEEDFNERIPSEFFQSLPEEFQYAAKYFSEGGTDMKGLFRALSQVQEVKELDPAKDAKEISYQYLKATNFGDEEEIREQIAEWEDLGVLDKKSTSFKPKLDKMQEQIVQQKIAEQEHQNRLRQEAAQQYVSTVKESLKEPELNGLKLDKKTHEFLVNGLLQAVHPSVSGKNTNLLGFLLEQHQLVKPNYPLIAEAMWLLSDPNGYREKIKGLGSSENTEKIVRTLKTESSRRPVTYNQPDDKTKTSINRGQSIPMSGRNILRGLNK